MFFCGAAIALSFTYAVIFGDSETGLVSDSDGTTSLVTRGGTSEFSLRSDGLKMKASWKGDVSLDDTGNAIASVEDSLELRIEDEISEQEAHLEEAGRKISIRYWLDGVEQPQGDETRAAVDALTLRFFRASDIAVNERVKKLLKHGEAPAVLEEIDQLTTDHATARYIEVLTKRAKLSGDEIMALAQTASRIEKDSSLGQALNAIVENQKINDVAAAAIIEAASALESDYDKRRLTTALAGRLPKDSVSLLITMIETIESDYDLRLIAESLAENKSLSADDMTTLLTITTEEIDSDHDMRLILEKAASHLHEASVADAWIAALANIDSDYDKRKALEAGSKYAKDNAGLKAKLRSAAEDIDGDHDREEALAALQ